ncbi:MAG: GNAT family N-acetyltransferase [Bacteroidia bacterium]|jgi:GNAT superfamily N-acetyltransferase|nr:GNAT family N-acetyltransferase [Bacteroidia bacterium]
MAVYEARWNGYLLSTDPDRLDIPYIHHFLSTQSHWAQGISRETVQVSIQHALCVGVYADAQQVAFCRVITDRSTFAYLGDVFVDPSRRGQGISKWMMEQVMAHPDLQGLRRIILVTADAHGLYARYGYTPLNKPERWMEIWNPDVYRQA